MVGSKDLASLTDLTFPKFSQPPTITQNNTSTTVTSYPTTTTTTTPAQPNNQVSTYTGRTS
jgi:hypothetical protein